MSQETALYLPLKAGRPIARSAIGWGSKVEHHGLRPHPARFARDPPLSGEGKARMRMSREI